MTIFSNYKCPNGLPPEECLHFPQLVKNVANYFARKQSLKTNHKEIEQPKASVNVESNRSRERRRG